LEIPVEDRRDGRGIRFTVGPSITGWHVGRAWSGHAIEDACPCQQEACGLVSAPNPACEQHNGSHSTRQGHPAAACPGPPETRRETDAEKIKRLERQLAREKRRSAKANLRADQASAETYDTRRRLYMISTSIKRAHEAATRYTTAKERESPR
jgi:hypothetical protein